jgi:RNA polymerase sigma-70 factor (ECF subfamily)
MGDGNDREQPMPVAARANAPLHPVPADLERLFRDHHERVFRAAYRITGHAGDAEDVLQTVFLRLLNRAPGAEIHAGYLQRAAVNAALDVVRERAARQSSSLDDAPAEATGDDRPGPEREHEGRELGRALRAALAGLHPRSAEVFALRYFEDLDNDDIARLLDMSKGTVAVTLHRARTRLKDALKPLAGDRP